MLSGIVVDVRCRARARHASTADDGRSFPFHCTQIADGTRSIAVGAAVRVRRAGEARPLRSDGDLARDERASRRPRSSTSCDRCGTARWSATATSPTTPGCPGSRRLVGNVLAGNDDPELPWWRVVNSVGRLVPGNEREQAARLRAEGVDRQRRPGAPRPLRPIQSLAARRRLDLHEGQPDLEARRAWCRRRVRGARRDPRPGRRTHRRRAPPRRRSGASPTGGSRPARTGPWRG